MENIKKLLLVILIAISFSSCVADYEVGPGYSYGYTYPVIFGYQPYPHYYGRTYYGRTYYGGRGYYGRSYGRGYYGRRHYR